jgi:hypothetical protein
LGWSIAMQAMGTQPLQKSTRIVTLLQISFLLAFFLKIYTSIPILYKLFSLNPLKVTKKKKRRVWNHQTLLNINLFPVLANMQPKEPMLVPFLVYIKTQLLL